MRDKWREPILKNTEDQFSALNLSDRLHQGENWKLFRREWKFYELAAGIHKSRKKFALPLY